VATVDSTISYELHHAATVDSTISYELHHAAPCKQSQKVGNIL